MKPVLVLDAGQRSALAVTRSLGRRGVSVQTGESTPDALAASSRFSQEFHEYPSPQNAPEAFIERLVEIVEAVQAEMLLPMTELTSLMLLENSQRFSGTIIPFAPPETVNRLADKCRLVKLARTLDVPVPRSWIVEHPDRLPAPLESLPWPLVLKPGKSWLCTDGHWQRAAVQIADSPQAARAILDTDPAFSAHPFLMQEFVEGQGAGVFALYHHGHAQAFFAHRRIREKPPSGGVSVLSESITPDPVQLAHARALLDTVDWHGVAMVEYRVAPDGTPWLMEINTRFWGSLQLAVDAGMDFPWLLYRYAMGDETPPKEDYASGRRLRWLLGDLDHLYLVLRDRHCTLAQKLRAVLRFIWPSPFRTRHEINRWSDPAPAWFELKQWLRELL